MDKKGMDPMYFTSVFLAELNRLCIDRVLFCCTTH